MILFCDSFKHYNTQAQMLRKYPVVSSFTGWTFDATGGRFGGQCLASAGYPMLVSLGSGKTALTQGVSLYLTATMGLGNAGATILSFFDDTTTQVKLQIGSNRELRVYRGSFAAVLGTSSADLLPMNQWFRLECRVVFSNTVGSVEVKVNGVVVWSLTGIDTCQTANEYATGVGLHGAREYSAWASGNVGKTEDWVVTDNSSPNADYLGDVRIHVLQPNGAGTYQESGTNVGGSSRADAVDDTTPDDDSTYNPFTGVGQRNTYTLSNLPGSVGTVYGVQQVTMLRKDDAADTSARQLVRSGSTDSEGSDVVPSTSYTYALRVLNQDPNGSVAWTTSAVDALEAGLKRQT